MRGADLRLAEAGGLLGESILFFSLFFSRIRRLPTLLMMKQPLLFEMMGVVVGKRLTRD